MKLDLILENIRNRYSLGVLEESDSLSEIKTLQLKMMINESTMQARKILIDNGLMESTRIILETAFIKAIEEMAPPISPAQKDMIHLASKATNITNSPIPIGYTESDKHAIDQTKLRLAGAGKLPTKFRTDLRSVKRQG